MPGLQRHQIGLRTQHFRISTFSRLHCDQTVRPRGPMFALFCITEGPAVNAFTGFKRPLQYCPEGQGPTPENFSPQFPQISGSGNFLLSLYGDPKAHQVKILITVPPTSWEQNFEICGKSTFFDYSKSLLAKMLTRGRKVPPYNWARVHPRITKSDRSLVGWLE